MRHPVTIAKDLESLRDSANLAFVPVNVTKAIDLMVEFAISTAEAMQKAGYVPEEPGTDAPASQPQG